MNKKLLFICCTVFLLCSKCVVAQENQPQWHVVTNEKEYIPISDLAYMLFSDNNETFSIVRNDNSTIDGLTSISFASVPLSVKSVSSEKISLALYPNPVTSQLILKGLNDKTHISVLDINGRVVIDTTIDSTNTRIDVAHLPAGMYILKAKETSVKFIKK